MPKTVKTADGAAEATGAKKGAKRPSEGLRVERVFTTEGVHPYDEVKWESRDVVMTNWRDGSVNFEQRGVEFPEFWSQNATQIVTSKYFRGAVGTPQRERSLKQLIDRVVNAYHNAGVKDGYFATAADAQIFADELTWLLLHQYFSFNSPVWFNVGTEAAQQVSACQPYGALVSTPAGPIPIGKLVEDEMVGTKVYGAGGLTRILAVKANGVKDVLRVHTKSGHRLDVTADHLVWKPTGDNSGRFVEAGSLREGDQLEWHRWHTEGESEFDAAEMYEAALAGWLQADGFVGQYDHGTNRSLTVEAIVVTDDEREWVTKAIEEVFPGAHYKVRDVETQDKSIDCKRIRLYGEHLRPFVDKWGLLTRGAGMTVPERLYTAPLPVVKAYLRSVFQAEGYVSARERSTLVACDMVSEELIRGMQELLQRFAIFSRVTRKRDSREDRQDLWSLGIQNDGDRGAFAVEIGFVCERKHEKLVAGFDKPGRPANGTKRLQIARIERLGPQEVYDIQTESGEYLSHNLRVHNCFILSVDDTMESILDWYKEEGMIFKGGSGAGVNLSKIRASSELLSSGGNASGPISFMRGADASAGTIKSGGATRRAAKMVVLDVDHPDIEDFIETKVREEEKIRALRDAGFDVDLGGEDMFSVQYQNANNSVRVSDEFMRAVEEGTDYSLTGRMDGKEIARRDAREVLRKMAEAAWECADPGIQYDDTINDWHTNPNTDRIYASNPCSEYLSLNDSSCNLASLNLMKFLGDDGSFDVERFVKTVEFVITAMEISISFADFPTEKIGQTTRDYRQLGIGYSNLGALLMASGHAYDSDEGRALAAGITSLMTGVSYRRSAEIAGAVGPYAGYERNAEPHQRVMAKHAAACEDVRTFGDIDATVLDAAKAEWAKGNEIGAANGWRNAQASVLAPTGCLTGDTLITTDRGLTRLESLGDPYGDKWQDLDATVSTDEGPKRSTKFFVNGEEPTRRITTEAGYRIQGTLVHRVKVVDETTGRWEWKRLAEIQPGDLVPMQMRQLVGQPNRVPLPVLDQAYYTEDGELTVPDAVSEELAELVGYFMGDGSLHAKGLRLCVAGEDQDVADHLCRLSEKLFNLTPHLSEREGYTEVALQSVRLARWWQAAGFAKGRPGDDHSGKGWKPRIPAAILESNSESVYEAFIRGLFEADGTVQDGVQSVCTCTPAFADEIRTLLLVLGFATTTRTTVTGWGGDASVVRIRNLDHALNFAERIGFMGSRKTDGQAWQEPDRSAKRDRVYLPSSAWDEIVPIGHPYRNRVQLALRKHGTVARQTAADLYAHTRDERLRFALGYLFERVETNEDGGVVPTYDLSVPENVTYVANGMVSHNTISFMMDCDTTGIEPDLALVKHKKLVGGGSMEIVNQTVPRALASLGYSEEETAAIVDYIAEHGHVVDAPHLAREHHSVFDCAMGERSISAMGHVHMMAAVQPFLSGSVSKTVNLPETATVEDIEQVYFEGWKLGLKALAVYRDNCKVGQPLSAKKKEIDAKVEEVVEKVVEEMTVHGPVRRKLPKRRPSQTTSFTVGGAEGYITSSSYPDDGLGEVFLKMSKQGSTLAGVMDALSVSISIALQYGVPLEKYVEKFTNMRFEPAGMTDDPDIRMASSVVDYVFRRLALDYLPYEDRAALGILTTAERTAEVNGEDPAKVAAESEAELDQMRASAPIEESVKQELKLEAKPSRADVLHSAQARSADAPLCMNCGTTMRPAGSCYACEGCGATSGCS